MPGIDDWINGPLPIIQGLFDENKEAFICKVKEYFGARAKDATSLSWVPSLNNTKLHNLRTNTLVRYRCMVQDMYDPEYFLGVYEVNDLKTGNSHLQSGMFKDIAECRPGQEINLNSLKNVTCDRQTLYCVPIPAENGWVKEAYGGVSQSSASTSSSSTRGSCKRPADDTDTDVNMETTTAGTEGGATTDSGDNKRTSVSGSASNTNGTAQQEAPQSSAPDLNFPLPGEQGPACLVKLYDEVDQLKVNDTLEFIGILSNDPAMVQFHDNKPADGLMNGVSEHHDIEEDKVKSPPPSLVPRLHVILTNKLEHNNPYLPASVNDESIKEELSNILSELDSVRRELVAMFEQALLGDKMAAEYMLCHLISSVYSYQDVQAIGKFSLNLSGCPMKTSYAKYLYELIAELVTKSYRLEMTVDNMNKFKFVPKKDYTANRLCTGVLQLSSGTHLVVDETVMEPGQLDTEGVKNITALGQMMTWQKIEYDFSFHKQSFPTNIISLVLSEGQSLFKQCDCHVKLTPTVDPSILEAVFKGIHSQLMSGILTKFRTYLGLVQLLPFNLPDTLQKEIEADFVKARKDDPKNMTVEDFNNLLVLARLQALSYGKGTLNKELWEKAKSMEMQRKKRFSTS